MINVCYRTTVIHLKLSEMSLTLLHFSLYKRRLLCGYLVLFLKGTNYETANPICFNNYHTEWWGILGLQRLPAVSNADVSKNKKGRQEGRNRKYFWQRYFFSSFLIQNTMYDHVIFTWRIFCLYWGEDISIHSRLFLATHTAHRPRHQLHGFHVRLYSSPFCLSHYT